MLDNFDVIIVGGGPAAVHAAVPLVENGLSVLMVDGGVVMNNSFETSQSESFESIRRTRIDQDKVFLGDTVSGALPPTGGDQGSHMSAGRFSYVIDKVRDFFKVQAGDFYVTQTLAQGGMSEVWGAACGILDDEELAAIGLPGKEMREYYQTVIDSVGVSGISDLYKMQPAATVSTHAEKLLGTYIKRRAQFDNFKLEVMPAMLALLTRDLGVRRATNYNDTEYWSQDGGAVYRARYTLDELRTKSNFHYIDTHVVQTVENHGDGVFVSGVDFEKKKFSFAGKKVILAAGSLSTVRILLKSLKLFNTKIKITSKPHIIVPCIDLKFLGKTEDAHKHGLCQAMMESSRKINGFTASSTQIYTYKSLLLFKLLNFLPFTGPESLGLLALYVPSMIIADSRFPSAINDLKTCELVEQKDGDVLLIDYKTSDEDLKIIKREISIVKKGLRALGLIPLKEVYMQEGTSTHYAGGVSVGSEGALQADKNGCLVQMSHVYVADASLWRALSAKPPTLTIMANARRIGAHVAQQFVNKKA